MKLLCDEMLRGLARWLRAAGYDTQVADPGNSDQALRAQAMAEGRLLISRDRKFREYRDQADWLVLLQGNTLADNARELTGQLSLDWLHRPFSRCLLCNQPLQNATPAQQSGLPEDVRALPGPILYCPHCNKLYWQGGHVMRMRRHLQHWQQGDWQHAGPEPTI